MKKYNRLLLLVRKSKFWCSGCFTSITTCGVWGARVRVQVFRKEFYTHIHLNYAKLEFLSCKKRGGGNPKNIFVTLNEYIYHCPSN